MELIRGKTICHHFLDSILKCSSRQRRTEASSRGWRTLKNFDEHGGKSRLKFDDELVSK